MNQDYWLTRWQESNTGFHKPHPHPLLTTHYAALELTPQQRIFIPLCGKSHDIGWLLKQGVHVIGCELSAIAIEQLFSELNITPQRHQLSSAIEHWQSDQLEVFVGDIFTLSAEQLNHIDAVYDRGALVALPAAMRQRYCKHLCQITGNATQLLITFEYEQSQMQGPPFSISRNEIEQHYGRSHQIEVLAEHTISQFKHTAITAREIIYKLTKKGR